MEKLCVRTCGCLLFNMHELTQFYCICLLCKNKIKNKNKQITQGHCDTFLLTVENVKENRTCQCVAFINCIANLLYYIIVPDQEG